MTPRDFDAEKQKNYEEEIATQISKEAYFRFIQKNSKTKIFRGTLWFLTGLITSIYLFWEGSKISYIVSFGTIWGFFQIASGISKIRTTKKIKF